MFSKKATHVSQSNIQVILKITGVEKHYKKFIPQSILQNLFTNLFWKINEAITNN